MVGGGGVGGGVVVGDESVDEWRWLCWMSCLVEVENGRSGRRRVINMRLKNRMPPMTV